MRSPPHRFRRIFRAKSEATAKSENRPRCRAKSEFRLRWKNPNLGAGSAGWRLLCRAGAAGWRSAKPYDRMIRMIRMTRRAGVSGAAGNRHQPFFGCCPCGVPRGVQTRTARTAQRLQRQLQTAPRESANTEHSTFLFRGGFPNGLYST